MATRNDITPQSPDCAGTTAKASADRIEAQGGSGTTRSLAEMLDKTTREFEAKPLAEVIAWLKRHDWTVSEHPGGDHLVSTTWTTEGLAHFLAQLRLLEPVLGAYHAMLDGKAADVPATEQLRARRDAESRHIEAIIELRAIGDLMVHVDDPTSIRPDTWTTLGGRIVHATREADTAFYLDLDAADPDEPTPAMVRRVDAAVQAKRQADEADRDEPAVSDLGRRLERIGAALFTRADHTGDVRWLVLQSDDETLPVTSVDELRELVVELEGYHERELEHEGEAGARSLDMESDAQRRLEHFGISLFSRVNAVAPEYAIIDGEKLVSLIGPHPSGIEEALREAVTEVEAVQSDAAGTFVPPADARPLATVRAYRGEAEADRFEAALARAADLGFSVLITSAMRDGSDMAYSIASGGELFLTAVPLEDVEGWIRHRAQGGAS